MKVIHLQTQRVIGTDTDGESIVEQKTVQLEDGKTFDNFVKRLKANGYRCKGEQRPKVVNVVETVTHIVKEKDDLDQIKEKPIVKEKELKEDIEKYQAVVDAELKPQPEAKGEDVESLKADNKAMADRLAKLEEALLSKGEQLNEAPILDDKEALISEITDRGGQADKRMGIEKLNNILEELKK